jgi:PAS domain S-box-containing protein
MSPNRAEGNAALTRPGGDRTIESPGPLHERLGFASLLARLSATFIHLPAEAVDGQIEDGLRQLVEFLQIDRSSVVQFAEDGSRLVATHSFAAPGVSPFPPVNIATALPWYAARVREGQTLRWQRLPDGLPDEAVAEREHCRQVGLRSQLTIPFKVGDVVLGGIGFGSFRRERDWPDDLVQSLQLVAEVFANAQARKRADVALRESEGRFRRIADTSPVMIWMSGVDKRCTYFNKPWLDFTGRALEAELDDGWSEGVHRDDLRRCLDIYVDAFDARKPFRMEYRLRRFDAAYRWVLDTGVPRFGPGGGFEGYVGSCIDITDQKCVEDELRESEARLRFLLESTHAVPWVADARSWRFTYVGPQAGRLLGYPAEAWHGEGFWADHIHPDDRDEAVAFCLDRSGRDLEYEFEYRMVGADGRAVWVHDIVNVVPENGSPKMLRGFLFDVTARRQAEEDLRGSREQLSRVGRATLLGELAASIAHEVNQPLCAIVANAQAVERLLAAAAPDLGEVREAVLDITRDGQRASAVIDRIRGMLRKAPLQRAPVGVNDLLREVAALVRGEMGGRGIIVKLELANDMPAVHGDRVQLQQVVLNLLANGADAIDRVAAGARELCVHSAAGGPAGVRVGVSDTGAGLTPADRDRLFEPFFTTKAGGMGMGLSICKTIVEAHGGSIAARPNRRGGSTFEFSLPYATGDAP